MLENILGNKHPKTINSYTVLGGFQFDHGNYNEALMYFEKVRIISEEEYGCDGVYTASVYCQLADIHYALNDTNKALEYYKEAMPILENGLGLEHPTTANVYKGMGRAYNKVEDFENALSFMEKTLVVYEKLPESETQDVHNIKEAVEDIKKKLGKD